MWSSRWPADVVTVRGESPNVAYPILPWVPTISVQSRRSNALKHHVPVPCTPDSNLKTALTMSSGARQSINIRRTTTGGRRFLP